RAAYAVRNDSRKEKPLANAFWHNQKLLPVDTNRAKGLFLLGDVELSEGNYNACLNHCLAALKIARSHNMYRLQAELLSDISGVYLRNNDIDESLKTIAEAAAITRDHQDYERHANMLEFLSIRYFLKGNKKQALYLLDSAIAITKLHALPKPVYGILITRAAMLVQSREPEKALAVYKTALAVADTFDLSKKAFVKLWMAKLYAVMKQNKLAQTSYEDALSMADQVSDADFKVSVYSGLFLTSLYIGDSKKAALAYSAYDSLRESVNSKEKQALLAELRTKYDSDLKDSKLAAQSEQLALSRKVDIALGLLVLMAFIIGIILYVSRRRINRLFLENSRQKEELMRLNMLKDRILSTVSHDMRMPINSLMSVVFLLERRGLEPDKFQTYMNHLKSGLSHTSDLMTNLLEFARSQMQGFSPRMEILNLADAVNEVLRLYEAIAIEKNVALTNAVPPDAHVYADAHMLAVIIRNLLSNAIKFTPESGTVTMSAYASGNNLVCLAVSDTGIGISVADTTAFNTAGLNNQPMASAPGTDGVKGTGLGLMLSKNLAAAMNGHILLESELNKGSTFTVCFQNHLPEA
ncbi:MAG: HAMP domain-containing sensor histidine kinase, partial [Bacteroidota bacterium]